MLIEVRVNVWPADRRLDLGEHFQEFQEAVWSASHNLYSRHKIILDCDEDSIIYDDNGGYYLTLHIPEEIVFRKDYVRKDFNIGNRLRGISVYLLHNTRHFAYDEYRVGTRLLNYRVTH